MVIPDAMNDVFLPQGRYSENVMLIYQFDVCQEGGVKKGVLGGCGGFLIGNMVDRAIPDIMNDVFIPQGRYPENFVLIFQLKEGQEGGGQEGGT